ncbi:MAG: tRNA-(ms[2]io[6]A)-hydroxylase, partial [Pseudomonadales bacterium]|nr:tRNA-(ms[2]io[6]A)-hydroxylase [Pseudomonadales bacterium]
MNDNPQAFVRVRTPDAWLETALGHIDELLIDHANCEKKAASTALNMIYRYVDKADLMMRLSKVAREELRHFEQVLA